MYWVMMRILCRENDVTGSQNNITMYRSLTRGESTFRRGSNVSLHDGGSGWSGSGSGDMRSLSMFSRSKSSSATNLGPSSLQLGTFLILLSWIFFQILFVYIN